METFGPLYFAAFGLFVLSGLGEAAWVVVRPVVVRRVLRRARSVPVAAFSPLERWAWRWCVRWAEAGLRARRLAAWRAWVAWCLSRGLRPVRAWSPSRRRFVWVAR